MCGRWPVLLVCVRGGGDCAGAKPVKQLLLSLHTPGRPHHMLSDTAMHGGTYASMCHACHGQPRPAAAGRPSRVGCGQPVLRS